MPAFFGFILGVIATIFGAYLYDSATGRASNGLAISDQSPMVNWNVVENDWQVFQARVRATADNIEHSLKPHSG